MGDGRNITEISQNLSQRILLVFAQLLYVRLAQIVNQGDFGESDDDGVLFLLTQLGILVDLKVLLRTRYVGDILEILADLESEIESCQPQT